MNRRVQYDVEPMICDNADVFNYITDLCHGCANSFDSGLWSKIHNHEIFYIPIDCCFH